MITEPLTDKQRTPLQEFETLYIGGAELTVVRRAPRRLRRGQIKTMRDCEGKFIDQDDSYRLGDGSSGNKHEVER